MSLKVAGFLDNSLVNGEGIRSVLFVSGCRHNCTGCHNKDMQNYNYGEKVSIDEAYNKIMNNYPLIKGVTFSGGEPFDSAKPLSKLAIKLKEKNINIWCYTGYKFETILNDNNNIFWKELLENIDVLVDGKYEKEKHNTLLKYKGSSNQRIIEVKESLKNKNIVVKEFK